MRVQSSLTDWQGKLRVTDVVGDSLRVLVRRPALALLAPTASVALAGWAAHELDVVGLFSLLLGSWGWFDVWTVVVQLVLALPLLALSWALLASAALESSGVTRGRRTVQVAKATVVATLLGLVLFVASFSVGAFAIFLIPLVGIAVPVCVCERVGPFSALGRAVALMDGNALRLVGAWLILELLASIGLLLIGVATFVLARMADDMFYASWLMASLLEALSIGLTASATTALSIAAYGRLRQARVELDVDRWVEVFR